MRLYQESLAIINYQLLIINYQLSIINLSLSIRYQYLLLIKLHCHNNIHTCLIVETHSSASKAQLARPIRKPLNLCFSETLNFCPLKQSSYNIKIR